MRLAPKLELQDSCSPTGLLNSDCEGEKVMMRAENSGREGWREEERKRWIAFNLRSFQMSNISVSFPDFFCREDKTFIQ